MNMTPQMRGIGLGSCIIPQEHELQLSFLYNTTGTWVAIIVLV